MSTEAPTRVEVAKFYDEFLERSLKDWVHGNARVSAAISRCLRWLPPQGGHILDVGCGIGASSRELADANAGIRVLGVDISPERIATAKKLFVDNRVTFDVSDMSVPPAGGAFDLITMIDVYEHIPRGDRGRFHCVLDASLGAKGVLVMTCPSPLHQKYLAEREPEGLQIVDETISWEDVGQLASDIKGTVVCYEFVDVWKTNQYLHVVIAREPDYVPRGSAKEVPSLWRRVVSKLRGSELSRGERRSVDARRQFIRSRIGVEV